MTAEGENDVVPRVKLIISMTSFRRVIEDFPSVRYEAFSDVIANGTFKVGLKWKEVTGGPAIKVYKSADTAGSALYATDDTAAAIQVDGTNRNALGTVSSGGDTLILPPDFWSGSGGQNAVKCLIFEGASEGSGQLAITVNKSDGTQIAEGPSVWLDLQNILEMYVRGKAVLPGGSENIPAPYASVNAQPPDPGVIYSPDPNGRPFSTETSSNETQQTIVFVHGWRMPYDESLSWAEYHV